METFFYTPTTTKYDSASPCATATTLTPAVDWSVVHAMPNADADDAILALIDLRGLDDLLLESCREPPIHHVAGVLPVVCTQDEACVMRSQAGCEHACTPWPPSRLQSGVWGVSPNLLDDL